MQKQTLFFDSLNELLTFSKTVSGGYLLNTSNNTITGYLLPEEINEAVILYEATLLATSEKVYAYDKLTI